MPILAAARQALVPDSFGAVLVDYDLDDGKGVELIQELKSQAQRPVVVAVSSHEAGNDALVSASADTVCSKMQFANIEVVLAAVAQQSKRAGHP